MQYRPFGRLGWEVSEIGYGMWGMAGWTGSDDRESLESLDRAVELGCTFFDTAYAYGAGHSETLLGQLVRRHPDKKLYTASKIPPKNGVMPSPADAAIADVFPPEYIREMTLKTLDNLGLDRLDLMQFHTWQDAWAKDESWQRACDDLKREGLVGAWGISVNRGQPDNVLNTLRTNQIDAVQVVYNIFDQAAEDHLFPLVDGRNIAVIARVPFDEGSLTGTLTRESRWPEGDFRNRYFAGDRLAESVERAQALKSVAPDGMTLPELALRFILQNPTVSTVIPGMRKRAHVEANIAVSDGRFLPDRLMAELRRNHRWDR
jgi:aryl-alcohol dehydrogenase-like predicted oxidoreductase